MESDYEPLQKKIRYTNEISEESSNFSSTEAAEVLKKKKEENTSIQSITNVTTTNDNSMTNKSEVNVGMTLLINKTNRFSGIVKQRYSDFMVRECNLQGKPLYLTNIKHIDIEDNKEKNAVVDECPLSSTELSNVESFVLKKDKTSKLTLDIDNDKDHRKTVHKYIKDSYKELETDTITLNGDDRTIQVRFKNGKSMGRSRQERNKKHCHFILFKQNKDTMNCVSLLSKRLHLNSSNFTYAGTKDKRATTIQAVAVKGVFSKQLAGLNASLNNIAVGNFSYSNDPLKLGDLSGNEFTLLLRNVKAEDNVIIEACQSLESEGFFNYFGLQRFGTGAYATHIIGKTLLKRQFEEAVDMILTPREAQFNVPDFEYDAKAVWKATKDASAAIQKVKSQSSLEAKLLHGLCRQKKDSSKQIYDYRASLGVLPRNMRSFYLHSYQSLVWNNALSCRIQRFGMGPVIGDLVLCEEKDQKGFEQVRILTKEDVLSNRFSIYDVVLPLPGYDMKYPDMLQTFYEEFLESDGLTFESMKSKDKEYSLSGKYRKMLIKPESVSWEILHYDDHTISLIENDLEKIKKATANDKEHRNEKVGKYKGIKLSLMLPSSSYATCALRELLLDEASFTSQVELNKNASSFEESRDDEIEIKQDGDK